MNISGVDYKNSLSKWLLAVVLLLSFFTFSGSAIQSLVKQNPSRTEAAYSIKQQAPKSIAYQRALKQRQSRQNTLSIFAESPIDLAYFNSLQAKTLGQSYSTKNVNRLLNTFLYQHTTIPQNNGDEPAIALV